MWSWGEAQAKALQILPRVTRPPSGPAAPADLTTSAGLSADRADKLTELVSQLRELAGNSLGIVRNDLELASAYDRLATLQGAIAGLGTDNQLVHEACQMARLAMMMVEASAGERKAAVCSSGQITRGWISAGHGHRFSAGHPRKRMTGLVCRNLCLDRLSLIIEDIDTSEIIFLIDKRFLEIAEHLSSLGLE